MKKILFCSTRYDPYIGGTETLTKMVINGFLKKDKNIEIHLLSLAHTDPRPQSDITFHDFRNFEEYKRKLIELRSQDFDISFCFVDLHADMLLHFDKNVAKKNIAILNFDDSFKDKLNYMQEHIKKLKTFDLVSTFTKKCFVNEFLENYNIKNTYVQNFCLDMFLEDDSHKQEMITKLRLDKNLKTILFLGRIEHRKNQIYIIRKLKELKNRYNLVIMGGVDPWCIDYFKQCVQESKMDTKNNIVFVKGTTEVEKIKKVLNVCDVLLLNSTAEGLPLVALEALSTGMPTLLTKVGGIPGVLGDISGVTLLSDPNPPLDELEQAVISSQSLNKNVIRQAWKENFTQEIAVGKYYNIFLEHTV
jgi:glycosyltransferase involved in cell wall biosynthesis